MITTVALVSAVIGYLWGSWGAIRQIRRYREALGMNPDPLSDQAISAISNKNKDDHTHQTNS